MTLVTFLHISDLHYEPDKEFDRAIVLKALLNDIREWRSKGTNFDAVIFSGDLVQTADSDAGFQKVTSAFIDPLLDAAALPRDKLLLCPGNHDINRAAVEGIIEHGLLANLKTVQQINEFIDKALFAPSLSTSAALARMEPYESFYASLNLGNHKSSNVFFKTRVLNLAGYQVGFACLNSAWRATGAPDDKDRHHLIVGERAVDLAIADLTNTDLNICLAHHPLDWLADSDSTSIEHRLYDAFDIVCFGHTHRSNPLQVISPLATTVVSQSGSIYANRRWFNGYHVIELEVPKRKVTIRSQMYLDNPRRKFVAAEIVAPGGVAEFVLKPHSNKAELTEIELFLRQGRAAIRDAANEHIRFARDDNDKRIDFSEAFVCQPLLPKLETKDLIGGDAAGEKEQQEWTADKILRHDAAVVLLGESECGRTSLLHHLSIRVSEGVCDQSRIPAIVSVPLAIKTGYEKAIRSYYANADLKIGVLNEAVRGLQWIVFLDDFNAGNNKHIDLLAEITNKYPKHRVVVSTDGLSQHAIREKLSGREVVVLEIGLLPRKSIRQLSRVRFTRPLDTGMDDPAYLLVMKHLNESKLPRTGYMVALLLWAAEQQALGKALNEAVLLENLVSFLLGKTNFEAALRDQFDPRAQEFLLRAIAVKLREAGDWVDSNELLRFVIDYFESRGLRHGAREVLDEFIACRLLIERNGHIAFRYSCYQEYFVAFDLKQDPTKLSNLMSGDETKSLLRYSRELDLWSSLSRELNGADVALLSLLRREGLDAGALANDLADIKFSGHDLRLKPQRVHELLANPPSKDELDEIMDKMERARTGPQEEKPKASPPERELETRLKPRMVALGHQRQGLILLARLIRNCDQEKLEQKKVLVEKLLRLWSAHTYEVLVLLSELINSAGSDEGLKRKLTKQDLETITNLLKFFAAAFEAGEVARNLTSETLRGPIEEVARNPEEHEGTRFFAAMAYAEGWDQDGIKLARYVIKGLKSSVLRNAALQKMLQDYKFQRYRTASSEAFRELIVESESVLQSMSNTQKSRRIANLIQQAKDDVGQ